MEHGVDVAGRETQVLCHLIEGAQFGIGHLAVGFGHEHQKIEQLLQHALVHIPRHLPATVLYDFAEGVGILGGHAVLFLEEALQYLVALCLGIAAEILAQKLPHVFHLRMHHLAVGLDDVGGQYHHGEQETVALSGVVATSAWGVAAAGIASAAGIATSANRCGGVVAVEHATDEETGEQAQRTAHHPSQKTAYPFENAHILIVFLLIVFCYGL